MSDQDQQLSAIHVRVGVHMGTHGETVRKAVRVDPDETVMSLANRVLGGMSERHPSDEAGYIVLQIIEP